MRVGRSITTVHQGIELDKSKMTEAISIDLSRGAPGTAMSAGYVFQTCLSLVLELEQSLQSSQSALLALNAVGTEQCIREQTRLHRALQAVLTNHVSTGAGLPEQKPWSASSLSSELGSEAADQLCAAAKRVQHLARVQAGLLRRSQQFLSMLANWMIGKAAFYGPPPSAGGFRECRR
jgi:hypothetical protein